ncbi:hypothetical protein A2625_05245 [candidate division WOR-1 bacterium RIFCSPHIGHO2_01_FULL_53_15]|uniref:Hydrogenase nickel incorporation protein HypA n=1 Tax=candidate division WOR-1 bacterium RIFCSPHIGHO2_01_FULL_53_15 TaxID=1802564 RepID=A0A1F4Q1M2_UNCSA|nr:MAG: hypothetical protein A2625_05245 [candidate division WOR-1 bacterium RIFCSPHIGHO2_01_FULL_53_15]OGC13076.1 MAG: hypothetical protein A3D23_00190 [candidate division WOR-1 bacterium RIFCSPHIGHO2_02_FULL_53_26]
MHGLKLVADVLREVLARCEGRRVEAVRLKVGENCHARPHDIEYLFREAARGTKAEAARLEIDSTSGEELVLESIRVE